jgi:hypothetical protein
MNDQALPTAPATLETSPTPTVEPPGIPTAAVDNCPLRQTICDLTSNVEAGLGRNDFRPILELLSTREYVGPPAGELKGSGFEILCRDAAPGETRSGIQYGFAPGEGFIAPREHLQAELDNWIARTVAGDDAIGPGSLRLVSIGCPHSLPARNACGTKFSLVVSALLTPIEPGSPNIRLYMALKVMTSEHSGAPAVHSVLIGDAAHPEAQSAVTGGPAHGIGLAIAHAPASGQQPIAGFFFPWKTRPT